MSAILIVDTNIWAYYFDAEAAEHRKVVAPLEKALKSERIAVSTVIVMELAHFLVKNLGPVEGGEKMELFLRFPLAVLDLDYRATLDSVELLRRHSHAGVGGRDATILAAMRRAGTKRIMTHDEAIKKVDWVQASDPAA